MKRLCNDAPHWDTMPAQYHINAADELLTLRLSGRVNCAQVERCVQAMLADELFQPDMPQLIDLREAKPIGREDESVQFENFIANFYRHKVTATIAIVSNQAWDHDICAWVYWLSCALGNAELFDDWTQACRWLVRNEFNGSLSKAAREANTTTP